MVSKPWPQASHDQLCRTQRSLKCSDQSGASSQALHCGQMFLSYVIKRVFAAYRKAIGFLLATASPHVKTSPNLWQARDAVQYSNGPADECCDTVATEQSLIVLN